MGSPFSGPSLGFKSMQGVITVRATFLAGRGEAGEAGGGGDGARARDGEARAPMSSTHLSKVQLHLLPEELGLVQAQPGVGGRQVAAEVDPDALEALEVLEGDVLVVGPKEGLELGLGSEDKRR